MDIYQPSTATDKPVVIFIYGGAWKMGESSEYKFIAHALTGLGYPVIIPNYRLYPSVTFPTFVNDVALAIAYAETHAAHLSVDINKHGYVLMGHSSGAHTAALLATQESFLHNNGVMHKPIGLIGLSGPYDLPLDDPEVEPVFGGAPAENVNLYLTSINACLQHYCFTGLMMTGLFLNTVKTSLRRSRNTLLRLPCGSIRASIMSR